jgi:Animal haem peroxidase/TAT (twin-arginine translocation) pathway signal sequence
MEPEEREENTSSSRRQFLKGAGAAGAGLVAGTLGADPALAKEHGRHAVAARHRHGHHHHPHHHKHHRYGGWNGAPSSPADFGRMFPDLPPFADPDDAVRAALVEAGAPGGILDAKDHLEAGGKALIVDPTVNGNPIAGNLDTYGTNPDNTTMTAGSTFVGQFVDHDITFDQTSKLGVPQNPVTSRNTRTPALDLDSVFGGGPGVRPDLYVSNEDGTVGPKLQIGTTTDGPNAHEDIPRVANEDGTFTAIIGDPRNDENLMVAGLHTGHIRFYNRVLDELGQIDLSGFPAARGADLSNPNTQFQVAQQVTLTHYHWLTVEEHLRQICGSAVVDDVLNHGNRFYRPPVGDGFMPIEFGAAAYRFGHSMVRPSYRVNFTSGTGDSTNPAAAPFFGLVFDPKEPNFHDPVTHDRNDFLGGFRAPRRYVGWQTFFDFGDGQVKPNKKIDEKISSELFTLPLPSIAPHTETAPTVLAQRNLLRQLTWRLPSGQSIARAMGVAALSSADLADIAGVHKPFGKSTPLWYYILREARVASNGLTLGPVGARIVAETLIGLIRADHNSYLNANPGFRPFLGADMPMGPNPNPNVTGNRSYTRAHFLFYAGVVTPGTYR